MKRSSRRLASSCLALSIAGLAACDEAAKSKPSQVIVVVNAEAGVRARADELKLVVKSRNDDDATVYNETLRRSDGDLEWPWIIAVTPKDGEVDREFEVVATAREDDGDFVAQVRAITSFVKNEKRLLELLLEDACIEITCDDAETCREGDCGSAVVDPNDLPPYDAQDIPDPIVVGPRDPDAGGEDGGPIGPPPAGDSGTPGDAGMDATTPLPDASVTPGCTPNPNRENEVCPEICTETCNNRDDDCDLKIDEGEADDDCDLFHATATCERGACVIQACTDGYRNCDMTVSTGCEAAPGDVNHCGACNNRCSDHYPNMITTCLGDTCTPIGCFDLFEDCDTSGDSCEVPTNTLVDCGRCGIPCGNLDNAEPTCVEGFCGPGTCIGNYGDCNEVPGDGCEQTLDTMIHCGACDAPCDFQGSTDDCSSGTCVAVSCESNYDDCDLDPSNGCESLASDAHCGTCNRACDGSLANVLSASCTTGACTITCDLAGGYDDCDDDPLSGCESTRTLSDCGSCDQPCSFGNAVASCDTGVCTRVRCVDGFDDCNADGLACEQNLMNDPAHCGACNSPCPSGMPNCSGGRCTAANCAPGTADCGSGSCNINTDTDVTHCGSCTNACAFTPGITPHATLACVGGDCVAQCAGLYEDCNGIYEDGCERSIATLSDCGGCNVPCSIAHANETCTTGSCRIATCDPDWDDCNMDDTSCETPLDTPENCNACGARCNLPNALAICAGTPGSRQCEISACTQSYFADCDGIDATGCEIDTRSTTADCGACDNDCTAKPNVATTHCANSACVVDTCDLGYGDCTQAPGCETALGASPNCGSCGDDCSLLPHTTATSCSSYTCRVDACEQGYDDCDGEDGTGCETSILTPQNCGGCASTGNNESCANLPHVAASSCTEGYCKIDGCAQDWLDCNGVISDGCEQQQSVIGPCFPDTNCNLVLRNGTKKYFFCRNNNGRDSARTLCQNQLLGDLVRIDDAAENGFVVANLVAPAWIGATDGQVEGLWYWPDNMLQFWSGGPAPSGGPFGGSYSNWNGGEPNNSGNEDCGAIGTAGTWGDVACSAPQDFVCEVQDDLCPNDPLKSHPGQCGCGVPDVHSDGDGTADCIDGCDFDPNKVTPGQCGCGNPDTDSDGDGTADCTDGCDFDPNKIVPGVCGCGTSDTDTDNDGTPDCVDACPYFPGSQLGACEYPYGPSNFDPRNVDFRAAPDAVVNCGFPTIDTSDTVTFSGWCDPVLPTPEIHTLIDNHEAVVIPLLSLRVEAGNAIRVIGKRPIIFAVAGDVWIEGGINARAVGTNQGAGGDAACADGTGNDGGNSGGLLAGAGGGGGGGFATGGGHGGTGFRALLPPIPGGPGGTFEGVDTITPLRAGCRGGYGGTAGGASGTIGGLPGAAGGAVQISAAGLLQVASGAIITASGGGGLGASSASDGGGGGGAGGAVLLEGTVVRLEDGAWVTANGGGGGAGRNASAGTGNPGTDGYITSELRAPGGPSGGGGGGSGGLGGAAAGNPTGGMNGTSNGGGGGGGGGAVGRIRVNGQLECSMKSAFSPAPASTCP